jgi:hypothetical protein
MHNVIASTQNAWMFAQVDDSLHMQFSDRWFTDNVIEKYLRGSAA